eukprot:TRINITY_DN39154_c0_g1_i1.p1 TRINITY_DN39154_c0_g1~~TRINITY_DN39154_c0_g1_i1.p1  ORF type:complete len:344 (+),score=24.57 TRINITY_DN39154_c0_g1_i1:50-1033(+)
MLVFNGLVVMDVWLRVMETQRRKLRKMLVFNGLVVMDVWLRVMGAVTVMKKGKGIRIEEEKVDPGREEKINKKIAALETDLNVINTQLSVGDTPTEASLLYDAETSHPFSFLTYPATPSSTSTLLGGETNHPFSPPRDRQEITYDTEYDDAFSDLSLDGDMGESDSPRVTSISPLAPAVAQPPISLTPIVEEGHNSYQSIPSTMFSYRTAVKETPVPEPAPHSVVPVPYQQSEAESLPLLPIFPDPPSAYHDVVFDTETEAAPPQHSMVRTHGIRGIKDPRHVERELRRGYSDMFSDRQPPVAEASKHYRRISPPRTGRQWVVEISG